MFRLGVGGFWKNRKRRRVGERGDKVGCLKLLWAARPWEVFTVQLLLCQQQEQLYLTFLQENQRKIAPQKMQYMSHWGIFSECNPSFNNTISTFQFRQRKLILTHFNKGSHTCGNLLKERGILITDLKLSLGLLSYFATNFMWDIFPLTPRPSIKYKTCNGIIQSLTTQLFMKSNIPLACSHMLALLLSYEFSFE